MADTVDDIERLRALSERHGVPGMDLTQIAIALEQLDVVPREVAETHRLLPVLVRGDRIFLAMEDPHERRVIDELEFVTGKKVYPYVAVPATLTRTIAAAYDAKARGEKHYLGPRVPEATLRQLGLAPRASGSPPLKPAAPPRRPPPSPPAHRPPTSPPRESVVVEEVVRTVSRTTEVSTSDFGAIGADVSSVAHLPEELRTRATRAADAVATGTGKLVLVVDDEGEIRAILRRVLTQSGYRVLEADRGLLALRLVKEHVPDLIVLDAMLPELHGFDIAARIKGSARYGAIPIVMVSAIYRGAQMAEDLKAKYGVDAFLEKPFRIADVVDAVRRLLPHDETASSGTATEGAPPDPDHLSDEAEIALGAGVAAYRAGQVEVAIEHLKRGLAIDPLAFRLHYHLGLLYGKTSQVYEGILELERALDLHPRHFAALKNLAVLYEKAGFKSRAVAMWERSALVAPDDATRASVREHLAKLI